MKKLSGKRVLLFGVVLAVCLFVLPSVASATNWGPNNTTHLLTSTNLSYTAPAINGGWICTDSSFLIHTGTNSTDATISTASFNNCQGALGSNGCTVTQTPTGFPWTVTGISTSNIQIHNIHIILHFETKPGGAAGSCPTQFHGQSVTLTGTLGRGIGDQTTWSNTTHTLTLNNTTGLGAHITGLGVFGTTLSGTFVDRTTSLTL